MATTEEIRKLLEEAKQADAAALGQGMDPVATHLRNSYQRKAEGLRQEALTLAICELLDTELVLADPAELGDILDAGAGRPVAADCPECNHLIVRHTEDGCANCDCKYGFAILKAWAEGKAVCRECGCTEDRACTHASNGQITRCGWAEPDLCTACVPGQKRNWIRPPRVAAPGG